MYSLIQHLNAELLVWCVNWSSVKDLMYYCLTHVLICHCCIPFRTSLWAFYTSWLNFIICNSYTTDRQNDRICILVVFLVKFLYLCTLQYGWRHYVSFRFVRPPSVHTWVHPEHLLTQYLWWNVSSSLTHFSKLTALMHFGTEMNASDFGIKKSVEGRGGMKYAGNITEGGGIQY